MTLIELPVPGDVQHSNLLSAAVFALFLYISLSLAASIYDAFVGPLSKFPGPKSRAFSVIPWMRTTWAGTDNTDLPALHREYGDVVRIGPNQVSFIGDSGIWKDIYGFRKHGQPEASKDPIFYGQPINRTSGLITADGPTHSRQRKIVSHAFSDKALKEQSPMLMRWAQLFRTKLGEQAERKDKTDLLTMLNCTTFDIMADLTFAEPLYMLENGEYTPWVKTIFGGLKYGARLRSIKLFSTVAKRTVEEVLYRVPSIRQKQMEHWKYTTDRVDKRLASTPDRPDLFTRILEKSDGPDGLSKEELYSISSLFMIAGTETTATALSGTMFRLMSSPKYLAKLTEELRGAFDSMEDMTLEALARLPILEATLKEGLRMYPPVPVGLPRLSPSGGMMVGEHFVPEGTSIAVHQLSTYQNEINFKEPAEFRPERWLGDPEFAEDKKDALEPFSVGPRNCLGKNLAWHEMRLLLTTLLLHFDVELCPESAGWMEQEVYTVWQKPALMCRLTKIGNW